MSNKEKLITEPNTTQIPNVILDYWINKLDELEFKILLFICRKTLGWRKRKDKIAICQICEAMGKSDRPVRRALSRLIKFQLVNRVMNKTGYGDNAPNSYEINMINISKKEKLEGGVGAQKTPRGGRKRPQGGADTPSTKPTTLKPTISKKAMPGGQPVHNSENPNEELEGVGGVLPFSKEKKEEEKASPEKKKSTRKYPRPAQEEEVFQWLKSLNLNTEENTLSYWAHTYPKSKLENAYAHLAYKMSKGYTPKNLGGFFLNLVKTENSPITDDCLENKKFAQQIKDKLGWASLNLHERFCSEDSRPDYDLPYRINKEDFRERLQRMWELKKGSRGQYEPTYSEDSEDYEEIYD